MKVTKVNLTLIFLMLFGAFLRFWNIGFQHTNWDEQWTMAFAAPEVGPVALIVKALSVDCNPPLYYLFAQLSMFIFGVTQEAIRYPSAIAGILLIPAMYFVGKQYKNELFGLMLAGFTTVFYNFVFYSKYGRGYGLELLFFAMAFGFFLMANKNQDNRKAKYLFALFCILTVWTQMFAVIPLAVLVFYLMWNEQLCLKKFDWVALIIVGCLPLLNLLLVISKTRDVAEVGQQFGAPLHEILFMIPLDIFTYSCFVICPIAGYMLWKYRKYEIYSIIIMTTLVTYVAMVVLSFKTPIILHYALPLTVMLLLPLIEAFYLAVKRREGIFVYGIVAMVILILEFVQIFALGTIQRGSW
jgi:4-amino-4-deoxy-L-arabinose transferase-like glycosyltransferase